MEFGGYVNFPIENIGKIRDIPILRQTQVVFGGKWLELQRLQGSCWSPHRE